MNHKKTQTKLNESWCVFEYHLVLSRANLQSFVDRWSVTLCRYNQASRHSKSPNCLETQLWSLMLCGGEQVLRESFNHSSDPTASEDSSISVFTV